VDGYEQCSSNVKEAPDPKRTKRNSIANVRKNWTTRISDTEVLFAGRPNSECSS